LLFEKIPEFTLLSQNGKGTTINDLCGRYLVLYFFPKANTSGCTREAQDFTSLLPTFHDLDAEIIGVSPDKPEVQANFAKQKEIKVTMVSDYDKTMAREFGAIKEDGKILRSTFLIDRAGVVRAQWKNVKVDGHAKEVLERLSALYKADSKVNPFIVCRRAKRGLSDASVSHEKIETLLQAAHLAPSCFNSQPWRFVAIEDEQTLTAVKKTMPGGNYWTQPAPAIIAVYSKPDIDCQLSDRRDYYLFGCGMAVGNLMLQATQMGLIAHPIAGYDPVKVKEILKIPDDYVLITLIIVGYLGNADKLSEKHKESEFGPRDRKPIGEVVSWDCAPSDL
jgi:peroxiredoxin/nitroreductase